MIRLCLSRRCLPFLRAYCLPHWLSLGPVPVRLTQHGTAHFGAVVRCRRSHSRLPMSFSGPTKLSLLFVLNDITQGVDTCMCSERSLIQAGCRWSCADRIFGTHQDNRSKVGVSCLLWTAFLAPASEHPGGLGIYPREAAHVIGRRFRVDIRKCSELLVRCRIPFPQRESAHGAKPRLQKRSGPAGPCLSPQTTAIFSSRSP